MSSVQTDEANSINPVTTVGELKDGDTFVTTTDPRPTRPCFRRMSSPDNEVIVLGVGSNHSEGVMGADTPVVRVG
jgi:hypothetical protein